MALKRDLFTGKWVEFEPSERGRTLVYREPVRDDYSSRPNTAWTRDLPSEAMKIHPQQVREFNEEAHKAGTGAYYRADGTCMLPSRSARNRELQRRGLYDRSGGYGDYVGN